MHRMPRKGVAHTDELKSECMMATRPGPGEDYGLRAQFIEVTQRLRDRSEESNSRPLAFWAVASDRRLPYALMNRLVGQVADTSFDELAATPGIGPKKMHSLIILLRRALADEPREPRKLDADPFGDVVSSNQFDPHRVSEVHWEQWCQTVRQLGFGQVPLGRFVSSLQSIPTVIWRKPLGDYLTLSIDQVRGLRAHGDKRVSAVLEVFCNVHRVLGRSQNSPRLLISLRPGFVPPLEQWITAALESRESPSLQEIRQQLVLPLLNQIELDGGETVHRLAAGRLGVESFPEAVRDQARELGVTRARVYQLLDTCYEIMRVRWPEGRWHVQLLSELIAERSPDQEAALLLESLQQLVYPLRLRERTTEPAIA